MTTTIRPKKLRTPKTERPKVATNAPAVARATTRSIPADSSAESNNGAAKPAKTKAQLRSIPIDLISVSNTQARKAFDSAKIDALAESIGRHGLLEPLVVRKIEDDAERIGEYMLVAGERRLRAAHRAQLTDVPCHVVEADTPRSRLMGLAENVLRENLNPIELAESYQEALDEGATQASLAAELGLDASTISTTLRLLKLPDEFRELVASGEMSASHAREVLPYVEHPTLAYALLKAWRAEVKDDGPPALSDWSRGVKRAIRHATHELEGSHYGQETSWKHIPWRITPTDEQRAALEVIDAPAWERGKTEPRAVNVKLAKQLEREAIDEAVAKWKTKQKGGKAAAGAKAKAELTPAEKRAREKDRRESLARRVTLLRHDWLRWLCARELREGTNYAAALRLVLWMAAHFDRLHTVDRPELLRTAIVRGHAVDDENGLRDAWAALERVAGDALDPVCAEWAALWLCDDVAAASPTTRDYVPGHIVDALVPMLGIDPAAEWQREKLGPFTSDYFELRDKAQLVELARELGVCDDRISASAKKGDLVAALVDADEPPLPADLRLPAEKPEKEKARRKPR